MTTTPRSRIHTLKTWPEHFSALVAGTKRCEIRYNDRDFRVGDCLVLQEFIPKTSTFTKEMLSMRVLHVTDFEQKDGYVVMSLEPWTQPPVAPDDTPPPFDQAEAEALVTALDDVKAGRIRTLDEIRAGAGKTVAPDDTPPQPDEELVPHPFNSRTQYEPGDDRDIWCKDCEYHRDHQVHGAQL